MALASFYAHDPIRLSKLQFNILPNGIFLRKRIDGKDKTQV